MVNTNEEMFYTMFVAKKHLLYVYKMFTLLPIWKQWLKLSGVVKLFLAGRETSPMIVLSYH